MPLLDHFHPPWDDELPWDTLHAGWATHLAEELNQHWLPQRFRALEHNHVGARYEIDVAAFERQGTAISLTGNGGSVATLPQTWSPPAAFSTLPLVFPDRFEVRVFAGTGAWNLVGAIELITPANKDRPETRQAFATKCASYLHQGVSVVLIDVVTDRHANLHNEVLRLVSATDPQVFFADDVFLYAAAYRPVQRGEQSQFDVWRQTCAIGEPLPRMPLRLTGDLFVPVDFESAYRTTCRSHRIPG